MKGLARGAEGFINGFMVKFSAPYLHPMIIRGLHPLHPTFAPYR